MSVEMAGGRLESWWRNKLDQIGSRQWQKFARETRVDADEVIARLISMAEQISDPLTDIPARANERIRQCRHRTTGRDTKGT